MDGVGADDGLCAAIREFGGGHVGGDKTAASFDPAPTAEQPQTLQVESLDAHSYAMDREELAESANAPQRDLDYAHISVRWETVDHLFFQVTFPEAMSLADDPPFVRAYQIVSAGGQQREVFDSALTVAATKQFFYSPLLRTALLSVRRPPQHSGYRILWRLGKPAVSAAPGTASELARLAVRRAALLAIRDCFAASASGDGAPARKARIVGLVTTIGTEVAKLLRETVAKTDADAAALLDLLPHVEITVMAMEGKVLRFVAGTAVADPPFWNVRLPLGEGIAGRAARLLDARTYDDEEAAGTVFAGVYMELEPGKRHAWLLAIPLWSADCGRAAIGVLNVGIFDPSRAYMLKVLGEPAQVRELAAWANGELLPKLLGVVSSN